MALRSLFLLSASHGFPIHYHLHSSHLRILPLLPNYSTTNTTVKRRGFRLIATPQSPLHEHRGEIPPSPRENIPFIVAAIIIIIIIAILTIDDSFSPCDRRRGLAGAIIVIIIITIIIILIRTSNRHPAACPEILGYYYYSNIIKL